MYRLKPFGPYSSFRRFEKTNTFYPKNVKKRTYSDKTARLIRLMIRGKKKPYGVVSLMKRKKDFTFPCIGKFIALKEKDVKEQ